MTWAKRTKGKTRMDGKNCGGQNREERCVLQSLGEKMFTNVVEICESERITRLCLVYLWRGVSNNHIRTAEGL